MCESRHWAPWTAEEERLLRELYPDSLTSDLAASLKRHPQAITKKAQKLGLRKSAVWEALWRPQWASKVQAQSKPFRPGGRPGNAKDVGAERLHDGYVWVKVREGNWVEGAWRPKHHLVWEAAHGPVPKGMAIWFKDRNRANCALENLELITAAERGRRNSIHNLPPDLKQCIWLVGAINRRLNHGKQ